MICLSVREILLAVVPLLLAMMYVSVIFSPGLALVFDALHVTVTTPRTDDSISTDRSFDIGTPPSVQVMLNVSVLSSCSWVISIACVYVWVTPGCMVGWFMANVTPLPLIAIPSMGSSPSFFTVTVISACPGPDICSGLTLIDACAARAGAEGIINITNISSAQARNMFFFIFRSFKRPCSVIKLL